ncbi:3-deoxy-D-manno-octulosonic acid kinase [Alteromonadaceae bacterium BrNp21-10]|nr:3-deoxy-D-manno-octulosonic acid kinase [Alteromonadaceae bacterium BrNp21-10]
MGNLPYVFDDAMSDVQQYSLSNSHILFDAKAISKIDIDFFDPQYWASQQAIIGSAAGRGTTHFVQYQEQQWVLRHYQRGGLIGKYLHDQYLYLGLTRTRSWQEFALLQKMQELQLPTPAPIAARVQRHGFYYTCDLITARIPQSSDAHQQLRQQPLNQQCWHNIGRAIAKIHNAQVYHHDLNIHNVMLDEQQRAWIIDFDKCSFHSGQRWKQDNLQRLYRSLQKEKAKYPDYHWQQNEWQQLLDGYYQR